MKGRTSADMEKGRKGKGTRREHERTTSSITLSLIHSPCLVKKKMVEKWCYKNVTGGRPRRAYRGSTCHDARAYSRAFRVFHSRSICVHAHHVCKCMNVDIHVCMLVRT
jgi:hypothetical protein